MNLKCFLILRFHEILKEESLMLFMSVLGHQLLPSLLLELLNLNKTHVLIRS